MTLNSDKEKGIQVWAMFLDFHPDCDHEAFVREVVKVTERGESLSWHAQLTHYLNNSDDLRGDIWGLVQSLEGELQLKERA